MPRRVTIDDLARAAGTSRATVSKVLNARGGYSDATRRSVEAAIDELGYRPIARESRRRPAVAALFDTLFTPYSLRVLEGIVDEAQRLGMDVVTQVADPMHRGRPTLIPDERYVTEAVANGYRGVIMVTSDVDARTAGAFAAAELPLVSIDASASLQETVPNVGSTHWRGGAQAARHLLELGHRRIAFIGGDQRSPGFRERFAGFADALRQQPGAWREELVAPDDWAAGLGALDRMLDAPEPPTAVFAATDGMAVEAIAHLRRRGLGVPDDVSVLGYDDTHSALLPGLELSSVHAPLEAIGAAAVRTVVALAYGDAVLTSDLHLSTTLRARATTKQLRGESKLFTIQYRQQSHA